MLGADIRILGEDDREVAPGETGEIVGRGRLVMAGYHAREDANREATWVDAAGAQWLRTGDLGRLDEEGFLYIVDRKKDMILSGGQNIYPADIESVMREHPAVAEVAVIGIAQRALGRDAAGRGRAACPGSRRAPAELLRMDQRARGQAAAHQRRGAARQPAAKPQRQGAQARTSARIRLSRRPHGESAMNAEPSDYFYDSSDGLRLYCRIYPARRTGGLPVLCLPGLTRNSRDFAALAAHLSAQREVLTAGPARPRPFGLGSGARPAISCPPTCRMRGRCSIRAQ